MIAGIGLLKAVADAPSSDAIASIVGAGIGSALAVFGAVWATDRKERARRNDLTMGVKLLVEPLLERLDVLLDLLCTPDRDDNAARSEIAKAREVVAAIKVSFAPLQPMFTNSTTETFLFLMFNSHFTMVERALKELWEEGSRPANTLYRWERTDFTGLQKLRDDLRADVRFKRL
jgi:hypothetical protein